MCRSLFLVRSWQATIKQLVFLSMPTQLASKYCRLAPQTVKSRAEQATSRAAPLGQQELRATVITPLETLILPFEEYSWETAAEEDTHPARPLLTVQVAYTAGPLLLLVM